jgi:hypothetical protein
LINYNGQDSLAIYYICCVWLTQFVLISLIIVVVAGTSSLIVWTESNVIAGPTMLLLALSGLLGLKFYSKNHNLSLMHA